MSEDPSSPSAARHTQLLALRPALHRYCARLMGSVIEGEDVVQDTFARAFAALNELEEGQPLRAWLFRIAHNEALGALRRNAASSWLREAPGHAESAHDVVMRRERVRTTFSAMSAWKRSARDSAHGSPARRATPS